MAEQAGRKKRLGVLLSRPRLRGFDCRQYRHRPVQLSGITANSRGPDYWKRSKRFHCARAFERLLSGSIPYSMARSEYHSRPETWIRWIAHLWFSRQTGVKGDPAFDAFYATIIPLSISFAQQTINRDAICAVLRRAGPSIFITHSLGSSLGLLAADGCPDLVKGHVAYEGDQSPFASYSSAQGKYPPPPARPYGVAEIPLVYDPPVTDPAQLIRVDTGKLEQKDGLTSRYPCIAQANNSTSRPRKLVNIAKSPILLLTGQASIHATYDQCTAEYLQQAGVKVKFTLLEKIGLLGNGHFGMLEKNSDAIAQYIHKWLCGIKWWLLCFRMYTNVHFERL